MKAFLIALALISAVVLISPASASAATNAGVKPGSFWYGFDLAFEKINLFFTFNSEGKARKALEYADERLAEAEAVAENNNTDAVKTAITNYESNIAFAAEKSKDVSEKEKAEALLTSIADSTSKHQEILADVLAKVPDEAKEAIAKAIEASRKGQEEAMRQVAELRGEVEQLKKEVAELKQSDDGNQAAEIEKLKQEIEVLKKKPTPTPVPVVSGPKPTTPPTIPNNNLSSPTPPPIETWAELEAKYFISADQKGWTSQIITNALGEKRYYRKEGSQWVRKNSEAEIQQPYVAPAPLPSLDQLSNLRHFCLGSVELQSVCAKSEFMPGYYSNLIFRKEVDKMVATYLAFLSGQQQQRIAAEKQTLDCIMAPTPEDERMMDPATQNYLRQIRCGTVTGADKTNYELSRIKSSVDELKYRLDSKISFPSLYLDPIKAPTFTNPRWEIRWEGSGGTISDSSGNFYQFHCEYNTCRSY